MHINIKVIYLSILSDILFIFNSSLYLNEYYLVYAYIGNILVNIDR